MDIDLSVRREDFLRVNPVYIYMVGVFMKKFIFGLLVCCAVMMFTVSCVSSHFSSVVGEVVLDTEGVLGHFDIEVKVSKHPSGESVGAHDPEIIAAVKREIAKLGGTRAINVIIEGRETSGTTIARVTGTVVK
jgi:hypothetical protein